MDGSGEKWAAPIPMSGFDVDGGKPVEFRTLSPIAATAHCSAVTDATGTVVRGCAHAFFVDARGPCGVGGAVLLTVRGRTKPDMGIEAPVRGAR
ncbi:hypothetical protein GCM10022140_33730 [Rhodococcus aetherivorans]